MNTIQQNTNLFTATAEKIKALNITITPQTTTIYRKLEVAIDRANQSTKASLYAVYQSNQAYKELSALRNN